MFKIPAARGTENSPHFTSRTISHMDQPQSVEETLALLAKGNYVADRSLATALYLSLSLQKPLFLEGEAGVGKTEIAKTLSATLVRKLIRQQC